MPPKTNPSTTSFFVSEIFRSNSRSTFGNSTLHLQGQVELELIEVLLGFRPGPGFHQADARKIIRAAKVVDEFDHVVVGHGPAVDLNGVPLHREANHPE